MIDAVAQNAPLRDELTRAFLRVLDSGHFILGPEVEAFEAEVAEFLGVNCAVGVSSGTDALMVALMGLGIGPGDEVLCPTFSFFATGSAIARVGARPVFCDVHSGTFNIDVDDASRRVTSRTKAIMPVHLFGQSADMAAMESMAADCGIRVIEDCAQALGATFNGRFCGTFGEFGTFSFYPTKNLGGYGEGGMVVTNDAELAAKARMVRSHGSSRRYRHELLGGNFRMDALQAALLRVKFPALPQYVKQRARNAECYDACLSSERRGIDYSLPTRDARCSHQWNQYTLTLGSHVDRAALRDALLSEGVQTEIYYPACLHQQPALSQFAAGEALTNAETLAATVLSLPCSAELSVEHCEAVAMSIAASLPEYASPSVASAH